MFCHPLEGFPDSPLKIGLPQKSAVEQFGSRRLFAFFAAESRLEAFRQ